MTTGISPSRMHPPKHPTLPQLLTTPENDCDLENDENLSTYYGIESAVEVPREDEFLFRNIFGKIANRAIQLVIKIKEAHLPIGPSKHQSRTALEQRERHLVSHVFTRYSSTSLRRMP
jgi:hypothetical protein